MPDVSEPLLGASQSGVVRDGQRQQQQQQQEAKASGFLPFDFGKGISAAWNAGTGLLLGQVDNVSQATDDLGDTTSESVVVRALVVLQLRKDNFLNEMRKKIHETKGDLSQDGFNLVWKETIVECDENGLTGPTAPPLRDALRGFDVFGVKCIDQSECRRLSDAVFSLIDIDGGGAISESEFTDFMAMLQGTEVEDDSDSEEADEPRQVTPMPSSVRRQSTARTLRKTKSIAKSASESAVTTGGVGSIRCEDSSGDTDESGPPPDPEKLNRRQRLLGAAQGTVLSMQRNSLQWAVKHRHRKLLEQELQRRAAELDVAEARSLPPAIGHWRRGLSVVWSREQALESLMSMPEYKELTAEQQAMVRSEEFLFDQLDLQACFKKCTGARLENARLRRCFALFNDRVPVSELMLHCTKDPQVTASTFNMAFAHTMRRKYLDKCALIMYIPMLALTSLFLVEHDGTGRLPGDIFQSEAVDRLIATEEFPGHTYKKTFFSLDDTAEVWEWLYGPVLQCLWNRKVVTDKDQTAEHIIGLTNRVLGGIKFRQERSPRQACIELDDLVWHGRDSKATECGDPQSMWRTGSQPRNEARWNGWCWAEFIVGNTADGGGVDGNTDIRNEIESYHIGLRGSRESPQPRLLKNITDCPESPVGHPTGHCESSGTIGTVPSKADWVAMRSGNETEREFARLVEPWIHHTCEEMYAHPASVFPGRYGGFWGLCDGYGLILPVDTPLWRVKQLFDSLYGNNWIDEQTRSLRMDFFTYNQHTGIFQRFQYLISFPVGGAPMPSRDVHSFGVFDTRDLHTFYIVNFVIAMSMLLGFIIFRIGVYVGKMRSRLRQVPSRGWLNFVRVLLYVLAHNPMCVYDLVQISLISYCMMLRFFFIAEGLSRTSILCVSDYPHDFEYIAYLQRQSNLMSAFTIVWLCLGVFPRLRTFSNARLLFEMLRIASKDIAVVLLIAFLIFGSCSLAAWLVYSQVSILFVSLRHTMIMLLSWMLGEFDVEDGERQRHIFTPVFFVLFQIVSVILLLNIVIAVFSHAFSLVQEQRFDPRPFLARINNDPATRFPSPVEPASMLGWVIEFPRILILELRYVFMRLRYWLTNASCFLFQGTSLDFREESEAAMREAAKRVPRVMWTEYVYLQRYLESGSPDEIVAATFALGSLCSQARQYHRTEVPGASQQRKLRGVFGSLQLRSADEFLNDELGAARKEEVEAVLVEVPSELLQLSQTDLWLELLEVHHHWRRGASLYSTTEDVESMLNASAPQWARVIVDQIGALNARIDGLSALVHQPALPLSPHQEIRKEASLVPDTLLHTMSSASSDSQKSSRSQKQKAQQNGNRDSGGVQSALTGQHEKRPRRGTTVSWATGVRGPHSTFDSHGSAGPFKPPLVPLAGLQGPSPQRKQDRLIAANPRNQTDLRAEHSARPRRESPRKALESPLATLPRPNPLKAKIWSPRVSESPPRVAASASEADLFLTHLSGGRRRAASADAESIAVDDPAVEDAAPKRVRSGSAAGGRPAAARPSGRGTQVHPRRAAAAASSPPRVSAAGAESELFAAALSLPPPPSPSQRPPPPAPRVVASPREAEVVAAALEAGRAGPREPADLLARGSPEPPPPPAPPDVPASTVEVSSPLQVAESRASAPRVVASDAEAGLFVSALAMPVRTV
eukprot:TRINITY_DN4999_c0_g1_i1.p1 TRINITY_DN4999_c0_g1~~TRINITY_DN4999_c0_g1_i1.p1  ORF type:complete len:1660 (+),score=369.14 TRINITY_DN4999_c0_g1_i1:117-5096(+)